jgi:hypothetical protein
MVWYGVVCYGVLWCVMVWYGVAWCVMVFCGIISYGLWLTIHLHKQAKFQFIAMCIGTVTYRYSHISVQSHIGTVTFLSFDTFDTSTRKLPKFLRLAELYFWLKKSFNKDLQSHQTILTALTYIQSCTPLIVQQCACWYATYLTVRVTWHTYRAVHH